MLLHLYIRQEAERSREEDARGATSFQVSNVREGIPAEEEYASAYEVSWGKSL